MITRTTDESLLRLLFYKKELNASFLLYMQTFELNISYLLYMQLVLIEFIIMQRLILIRRRVLINKRKDKTALSKNLLYLYECII